MNSTVYKRGELDHVKCRILPPPVPSASALLVVPPVELAAQSHHISTKLPESACPSIVTNEIFYPPHGLQFLESSGQVPGFWASRWGLRQPWEQCSVESSGAHRGGAEGPMVRASEDSLCGAMAFAPGNRDRLFLSMPCWQKGSLSLRMIFSQRAQHITSIPRRGASLFGEKGFFIHPGLARSF